MNIEEYRDYCIAKRGVTEALPFDENTLVFKVMGKIFAITDLNTFEFFNAKCDPEYATELREQYTGIKPGYHMNKQQWNSIMMDGSVPDNLAYKLIDDSYDLIVKSLPKKALEEYHKL